MASGSLAGNKIHNLPVSYHLPSSAQTFTSLFSTPQQVYVHAAPGRSDVGHGDEAWGAIYLKTVVQGIVMASPELHPAHPCSPDHSLYVLDPRETFLRRTRSAASTAEVWTGKGMVSWALDEPGVGKSLITGRLVRRPEFVTVGTSAKNSNPLEALVAANRNAGIDGAAWGIELCVGLKPTMAGPAFPGPLHVSVEDGSAAGVPVFPDGLPLPVHAPPQMPSSSTPHSDMSQPPSQQDKPKLPRGRPLGKKKKAAAAAAERERLQQKDQNVPIRPAITHNSHAPVPTPPPSMPAPHPSSTPLRSDDSNSMGIPAEIYAKPETLTKDQAQRLLESPAFLNMLEQLTGAPIKSATEKARAEADARRAAEASTSKKRSSPDPTSSQPPAKRRSNQRQTTVGGVTKCYNCGTTKSSVWRTKKVDDKMERVCNACGLYYNKTKTMRPPTLWSTIPAEPPSEPSEPQPIAPSPGFKRTLTQVAESDARRIANGKARQTRAGVRAPKAAGPMTSPPRAPAAAARVRNAKFAESAAPAASSPGGWAQPPSEAKTPARRPLADTEQNLAMPLSDDAPAPAWNSQSGAFFDVDGFSMKPGTTTPGPSVAKPHPSPRRHSEADVSSVVRARAHQEQTDPAASSEDDVFSQLFQRTSSAASLDALSLASSPFDFSQLPPSSPPALPSNLPHSALLLSSPSGSPAHQSPLDPSPRDSECSKISPPPQSHPQPSALRHSVTPHDDESDKENRDSARDEKAQLQDLINKLSDNGVGNADELLALFNNFPAANA
ncbi:hypothetical protein A1Q2_05804 [Trichosporon asahii var. asahii CBS 8904]|uniref:GATA-type domain-containing protein n=1 Tax=Trichosporon asahii var. asahii (strain CBS 8904) TaxID=1220162 RepID=K1V760_TRIAC|nr:hypothetical protein A1Q2_05804 [Trichosporon asahii var. asahii CBS 8904]